MMFLAHWSRSLLYEVSSPLIQVTTTRSFWPTDPGHYYRSFQPTDPGHYYGKFPAHWSRSLLLDVSGPTIQVTIWMNTFSDLDFIEFWQDREKELFSNANAQTSVVTVYHAQLTYLTLCHFTSRPTYLPNPMLLYIKTNLSTEHHVTGNQEQLTYLSPRYCTRWTIHLPYSLLPYIKTILST